MPNKDSMQKVDNDYPLSPGFTKSLHGSVATRAVYYPSLSLGKLRRLLAIGCKSQKDCDLLKDYKWMLLFDEQSSLEKGFLCQLLVDGVELAYVFKDKFWLVNIDARVTEFGEDPSCLQNNPLALCVA